MAEHEVDGFREENDEDEEEDLEQKNTSSGDDGEEDFVVGDKEEEEDEVDEMESEQNDDNEEDADYVVQQASSNVNLVKQLKEMDAEEDEEEEEQDDDDDLYEEDTKIKKGGHRKTNNSRAADDEDFDADDFSAEEYSSSDQDYEVSPVKKKKPKPKVQTRKRKLAVNDDSASGSDSDNWRAPSPPGHAKRKKQPAAKVFVKKKVYSNKKDEDSDEDYDPSGGRGKSTRTKQVVHDETSGAEDRNEEKFGSEDSGEEAKAKKKKAFDIMAPAPDEYIVERILNYQDDSEMAEEEEGEVRPKQIVFTPATAKFLIKWQRRSYRQSSWHHLEELRYYKGFKKVTNYVKRVQEHVDYLAGEDVGPEEKEDFQMSRQQADDAVALHQTLEKIVAERSVDTLGTEYLAKWKELPYADCTWETPHTLDREEDQTCIDEFLDRENETVAASSVYSPFSNPETRKPFKRMVEQPNFLYFGPEKRQLRDYQMEGLNWLAFSWVNNRNVILADEMGLGKTLQTICCVGWMKNVKKVPGPYLVVVPLSTIAAWQREFCRWLPDVNVVVYVGDGNSREVIRKFEFWTDKNTPKFNVLLTTPELVLADINHLINFRYALLAVDEAHRLKNEESSMHKALSCFTSANRLLITGTPLQNSIRELWALLNFLNPSIYESAESFEEKYNFSALRNPESIAQLHTELRPFILRRQKEDVEKSLPSKTYALLRVGLTSLQQQYYKWILTRNFSKLNAGRQKGSGPSNATSLQNIVVELKKMCNHPFLFPNIEDMDSSDALNSLIRSSGKLILLDKLLLRLKEKGHRVLIFSQMVKMLDILQDYCRMRAFACQRLDGSMGNEIRQKSVDHFNAPDSTDFVFLLSTRAGGLGINLATADTVIIFDSDWNPQNDLQAESRAHRIGQKKDVKVFRLISRDTVEEDILERAKRKRVLEHLVIHGVEGGDAPGKITFKKEELSAILRFGAERLFEKEKKEEEDAEGKPAGEKQPEKGAEMDDIDEILERAPKETSDDPAGATSGSMGDSLLNAFKWADFATEDYEQEEAAKQEEKKKAEVAAKKIKQKEDTLKLLAQEAELDLEKDKQTMAKENDSEFWTRVIPKSEQTEAVPEDLQYLGPRRTNKIMTYAEEVAAESKGTKGRRRGKPANGVAHNGSRLSKKDTVALVRSFKKFGSLDRLPEVLKDAALVDRLAEEEAHKLLLKGVEEARKVDQKGATISIGGEAVNALDLSKRVAELEELDRRISQYDKDTRFRLSKTNVRIPPVRGGKWLPSNDAMLLVGIHRHGFGNWELIQMDEDLNLQEKMATMGKANLSKRATKLLGFLSQEIPSKKNRQSGKISKKSASARKGARQPTKKAKASWGDLLREERETMEELRMLSEESGEGEDKKMKIRRTKECLLSIGDAIERARASHGSSIEKKYGDMESAWKYVAAKCRTALDGPTLSKLYTKVRDARKEKLKQQSGNAATEN